MESDKKIMIITGTRKGIGRYLVKYYIDKGYTVIGCSRGESTLESDSYEHFCLDVADELAVTTMVRRTYKNYGKIDILINNAGTASMNHILLTPLTSVESIFRTNMFGTFLFCREVAKVMSKREFGRIINVATVATPLKLEGEAIYAASKAAVVSFTQILAREVAPYNITCNAVGPTPVATDLIGSVDQEKIQRLIDLQAIKRMGEFKDISNTIDFFIKMESDFITGQVIYLGGL